MDGQSNYYEPATTGSFATRIGVDTNVSRINKTAFRVAGVLATKMLYSNGNSGSPGFITDTLTASDVDHEYIVVDATRCQNGEELACVLGLCYQYVPQ